VQDSVGLALGGRWQQRQIGEVEVGAILGSDSALDRRTIDKFGIYPKQYV